MEHERTLKQPTRAERRLSGWKERSLSGWWTPERLERLVAVFAWVLGVAIWELVSVIDDGVPGPVTVVEFLINDVPLGDLVDGVIITSVRFWSAMGVALLIGIVLGLVLGRSLIGRGLFRYPTIAALALPSFIWTLLGAMWFGTGWKAPVMTCVLSVFPFIAFNVAEGVEAVSADLQAMSRAYRVPLRRRVRSLYLPAVLGSIVAGFRVGVIVGWTAILIAEWFAGDAGLGFQAHYWYTVPSFEGFLSLCLVFVVYIVLIDALILEPLFRRSQRWRHDPSARSDDLLLVSASGSDQAGAPTRPAN